MLAQDGGAGVDHRGLARIAEVASGLSVGLAGGLTNDLLLKRDEAGVPGDLLTTVHTCFVLDFILE